MNIMLHLYMNSTQGQAGFRALARGGYNLHLNSRQGQAVGSRGPARGSFGHGHGRGRGQGRQQGRNHDKKVTAKDLDAELERYHLEAMQIN